MKTKTKLTILLCAVSLVLFGCASVRNVTVLATVQDVKIAVQDEPSLDNWLVSVKVDKVISGKLDAENLYFPVHSSSQCGLKKGKQYKLDLKIKGDRITVDQEHIFREQK